MTVEPLTDEQLKGQAIKQALAGDAAGARRTANQIRERDKLGQAWKMILTVTAERRDVGAVKETIASCPAPSLLSGHSYRDLPIDFVRGGDTSGGMGSQSRWVIPAFCH